MRGMKLCYGLGLVIMVVVLACSGSDKSAGGAAESGNERSTSTGVIATEQEEFVAQIGSQLEGIDAGIGAIEKRVNEMDRPTRENAEPLLKELREHRDTVQKNLDAMLSAKGQTWEDLKIKMQSAMFRLMRVYDQADKKI